MKRLLMILTTAFLLPVFGCCGNEDVISNVTTEVCIIDVRAALVEEIRSSFVCFSYDRFGVGEKEERPSYIASVDPAWWIALKVVSILSERDSPVKEGETYNLIIHSPVMILGFGLDEAVGKTTTVDFMFIKNADGSASLALEVPDV